MDTVSTRPETQSATSPGYTLMTPGPVPLPAEVLAALAIPMEHHRTPEFVALWNRVLSNLKIIFATTQPVYIHTATGSGAMESAIVNCLSPGDEILSIVSGKFGERWADMAEAYGIRAHRLEVPWGQAVRVVDVEDFLQNQPQIKAVLTQACETSTGVLHPVRELATLVRKTDAIFMVDAITAMGALPLPMDEWAIDVIVAGSQKAFMLPTGLSFIALSEKAWARANEAKCPRFYFDLRKERAANEAGESYFSSAVTHVRALDLVLDIFIQQGLHRVQERIQALSRATIAAAREMGIEIFAKVPSPSLTALVVPAGIDGQKLRAEMEKSEHVVVMGGQDQLKGRVIRIGHMGAISDHDLIHTLDAFARTLNRLKSETVSEAAREKALAAARLELDRCPAVVLKR